MCYLKQYFLYIRIYPYACTIWSPSYDDWNRFVLKRHHCQWLFYIRSYIMYQLFELFHWLVCWHPQPLTATKCHPLAEGLQLHSCLLIRPHTLYHLMIATNNRPFFQAVLIVIIEFNVKLDVSFETSFSPQHNGVAANMILWDLTRFKCVNQPMSFCVHLLH